MNREKFLNRIAAALHVPEAEITALAHKLWEQDGSKPDANSDFYWRKAESQLRSHAVLNRAVAPELQESLALLNEETSRYTSSAAGILQKEFLQGNLLPDGIRFHRNIGTTDYVVVEHQPMVRTILVNMKYYPNGKMNLDRQGDGNSVIKNVRVALPYVVYQFRMENYGTNREYFHIGFNNKPLKTFGDPLGKCALPNSYNSGNVCCPFGSGKGNLIDSVNFHISTYWQSVFNYYIEETWPNDPRLQSWSEWEKATEENSLFVLGVKWRPAPFTVKVMLDNCLNPTPHSPGLQDLSSKFVRTTSEILALKDK